MSEFTHDVFICHASEDKDEIARELAIQLKIKGVEPWYDEFSLKWGEKLMDSINDGLKNSLFGIVIFSPNFFNKKWPRLELDALVELTGPKDNRILPLLYNMTHEELKEKLPLISGIISRSWEAGVDKLASEITMLVREKKKIPDTYKAVFKNVELVDSIFRNKFENILEKILRSLESGHYSDINDSIDIAIMLIKERIDAWDVPSVKYGVERLFEALHEYNDDENDSGLNDLYFIFKDLFLIAHKNRRHIVGSIIDIFNLMLLKTWITDYDVEKAEKITNLLLRTAIDFVSIDLDVVKSCATAITNITGDMFEDNIFSKEILLAAYIYELKSKTDEQQGILDEILHWIKWDDRYSHDAGRLDYLKCGIVRADAEKDNYDIQFTHFLESCLIPIGNENMNDEIDGFIQSLEEIDPDDVSFHAELLSKIIDGYDFVDKNIANIIKNKVFELPTAKQNLFKQIIDYENLKDKL